VVVAFAACSGKTTDGDDESREPSETGGRTATGGVTSGGTPAGDAGDGGRASPTGGNPGASGAEPGDTGGRASTGGESGTGGAAVSLFGCGSMSCVEGKSYCYNYTSGTPGQQARVECKRLTEECSDCACLCPVVTPDGQCSGLSDNPSAACLCGGETGKIVISCFGS
jgi:hypothetical protein